MSKTKMKPIHSPKEIPEFASEAEEANFWATHSLAADYPVSQPDTQIAGLLQQTREERQSRSTTKLISLRLDIELDERIRELAKHKQANYQTLIKNLLRERVYEEEKRLGLVGK